MLEVRSELAKRGEAHDFAIGDADFPRERLGILQRHILEDDVELYELATEAARGALAHAGVDPARVRVVVVSTVSASERVPSVASRVQDALGLPESVAAFDLSLGCTGFVAAVDVASRMLAACPVGEEGGVALVVGAEAMSRMLDLTDRTTCPVFGDGAGAIVLESRSRAPRGAWTSRGRFADRIAIRARGGDGPVYRISSRSGRAGIREERIDRRCVHMEGKRVFKEMVQAIPELLARALEADRIDWSELDALVFHQANSRMIDSIVRHPRIGFDPSRVPSNLASVGNTSSASIPILIAEALASGSLASGAEIACVGFGTGYSVVVSRWRLETVTRAPSAPRGASGSGAAE